MWRLAVIPTLLVTLCSGCASIVSGQQQSLSVATQCRGASVPGAACKLRNDDGEWYLTTPGSVMVDRSGQALSVTCEKPGHLPALTNRASHAKGMAFGNIIFGGIIGGAVDMGTGAAYDYPTLVTVELCPDPAQAAGRGNGMHACLEQPSRLG